MEAEIDWDAVKTDFLNTNLASPEIYYSLKHVADTWEISHGTLRNKAAKEGWGAELKQARSKTQKKTSFQFNEGEIRSRQAALARKALAKAETALDKLDAESIAPKEIVQLLKLGLTEERAASGIPDKVVAVTDETYTPDDAMQLIQDVLAGVVTDVKLEEELADAADAAESEGAVSGEDPESGPTGGAAELS